MKRDTPPYIAIDITTLIVTVRSRRVILDKDLAALYGVPTFRFNEAVKRNRNRFPEDFMFQLTHDEAASLTSQIAMSKPGRGGRRTLPYAFTEHGTVMAANILRSPKAIQMSVFVVRAFIRMRQMVAKQRGLARKLAQLEGRWIRSRRKWLSVAERKITYGENPPMSCGRFPLDILFSYPYSQPILKRVLIISITKGGKNGCIEPTRFLEEVLEDWDHGGGGGGPHRGGLERVEQAQALR